MVTRDPLGTWEALPSPPIRRTELPAYQLREDPRPRDRGRRGRTTVAAVVSPSEGNEARREGRQGVGAPHSTGEPGEPSRTDPGEGRRRRLMNCRRET
jgi:hypothetical protein